MLRRSTYLENRLVMADSGVVTLDVNVRDPITSLFFEFRATNGATSNIANHVAQNVLSVDLIDGSEVLMSLTGQQLAALTWYHRGYIPNTLMCEGPGAVQNMVAEMQFGRWHGDTVYAFDPARFKNPQIRVTWNLATVNPIGATGFVTASGLLTVIADVMEGAPSPQGMLTAIQHYQFVTPAAGNTYIDLPVDKRLKAVMLRSFLAATGGVAGVSNVKLSADQDKFIPLDVSKVDLQRYLSMKNPPFVYKTDFRASDGMTIFMALKNEDNVQLQPNWPQATTSYINAGIGEGLYNQQTNDIADGNLRSPMAIVSGFIPYSAALIDLGEWDDPSTWLDATAFKSLRLILTHNVAAAACSVVLEQEKLY